MNTKWLLVLIALLALISTLSSTAALVLVMKEKSDVKQLHEKLIAIEAESANLSGPMQQQNSEAEQLAATLNLIFQRLNAHEQSLDNSVRELSERLTPRSPNN